MEHLLELGQQGDARAGGVGVGADAVDEDAAQAGELGAAHVRGVGVAHKQGFGGAKLGAAESYLEDFRMGFLDAHDGRIEHRIEVPGQPR